jgi:hypothetical protein
MAGTSGTYRVGQVEHGHKKAGPLGPAQLFTNLLNYLAITVSTAGATAVSAVATAESTTTAVESVVASVEAFPPHATNVVAIAKIAITFFIFVYFCLNYTLIDITTILNIWLLSFYIVRGPALCRSLT